MSPWAQPGITEETLPDLSGKVLIITGSSNGIGKEMARMVYSKNATVYIAARSESRATEAINEIKAAHPSSKGRLEFLHLDLGDLTTIRATAQSFLSRESRLDVLWLNAGVMIPPAGSKTTQGWELQLGTHNLGHQLLTKLLYPLLVKTAAEEKAKGKTNGVRVVWVSSSAAQMAPKPAINFANMNYEGQKEESQFSKYGRSKAGNVFQAVAMANRSRETGDGVISVSLDPGLNKTGLQKTMPWWQYMAVRPLLMDAKYGAYTELYAGLHEDITAEHSGGWVLPKGRLATEKCRKDLLDAEMAQKFWDWCDNEIIQYQ